MDLIKSFQKAGLTLEISDSPIARGRGMQDIVQLDIRRRFNKNARSEYFVIYTGAAGNEVQVLGVDKELRQLVLMINEPSRPFEQDMPPRTRAQYYDPTDPDPLGPQGWVTRMMHNEKLPTNAELVSPIDAKIIKIRQFTSPDKRYFLLGVDERQLFIAGLKDPATSVAQARSQLGRTVQFAEGKRRMTRQGEWFFLEITSQLNDEINKLIAQGKLASHKKENIGASLERAGGNPHVADELVRINNGKVLEHGYPVRSTEVYVRGAIHHVDHKTVAFKNWRLVIANNEAVETARGTASGIRWVD